MGVTREGGNTSWRAMATTFALNLLHFAASVCVFAIMYNLNVNNLAQRGKGKAVVE